MIRLGHRHIAFIGATQSKTTELRYEGARRAFHEAGLETDDRLLVTVNSYDAQDAATAVTELLARGCTFSALLVFNDVMAVGALDALESQGIQAPEQGFHLRIRRYRVGIFSPAAHHDCLSERRSRAPSRRAPSSAYRRRQIASHAPRAAYKTDREGINPRPPLVLETSFFPAGGSGGICRRASKRPFDVTGYQPRLAERRIRKEFWKQ